MRKKCFDGVVCLSSHLLCGKSCYNPSSHKCLSGVVCASNHLLCGTTCYDPVSVKCLSGVVCSKSHELCGKVCYNPLTHKCLNGVLGVVACPVNQQRCGAICYSPSSHRCLNGVICASSQLLCGTQCYDASTHECRSGVVRGIVCPSFQQRCGGGCYDPFRMRCLNGTVCFSHQSLCAKTCYDPFSQQCLGGIICFKAQSLCGAICYDPFGQQCIGGTICFTGQNLCGKTCYDPFRQQCLRGIICPSFYSLCGNYCYDPFRHSCTRNAAAARDVIAKGVIVQKCPLNEAFTTCSRPDVLCARPQTLYCTKLCGVPACRCKTGYARETNGKCVLIRACRQKPQPAVSPKCAVNKRFVLCSTPEGTCTLPSKTAPVGHPQCQCIPGYVRAGALCVAKSSCPAPKTTTVAPPPTSPGPANPCGNVIPGICESAEDHRKCSEKCKQIGRGAGACLPLPARFNQGAALCACVVRNEEPSKIGLLPFECPILLPLTDCESDAHCDRYCHLLGERNLPWISLGDGVCVDSPLTLGVGDKACICGGRQFATTISPQVTPAPGRCGQWLSDTCVGNDDEGCTAACTSKGFDAAACFGIPPLFQFETTSCICAGNPAENNSTSDDATPSNPEEVTASPESGDEPAETTCEDSPLKGPCTLDADCKLPCKDAFVNVGKCVPMPPKLGLGAKVCVCYYDQSVKGKLFKV